MASNLKKTMFKTSFSGLSLLKDAIEYFTSKNGQKPKAIAVSRKDFLLIIKLLSDGYDVLDENAKLSYIGVEIVVNEFLRSGEIDCS